MDITIFAILIWITAVLIGSLDVVMLIGSKNLSSRLFVLFTFITAMWVASQGFLVATYYYALADWLIRFQYVLGMIIALGFYHFFKIYPDNKRTSWYSLAISSLTALIFAYLYLLTAYMNTGVTNIGGNGHWAWNFGPLHLIFDITFSILWIISLINLYRTYQSSTGNLKSNLKNMFWAMMLGIIPPTMANIILPTFGYYSINWIGPISSAIWVFIIAYSIIRYRQMNVRTVVTEVLAVGMTVIFFVNIFVSESFGLTGRVVAFASFLILAAYLIRGVLRESKQREELDDLNRNLNQKVTEQTVEIRKSYEAEKKARVELEKLNDAKNQFIMITQHHLRTPLTSLTWGLESILNGAKGAIEPQIRQTIEGVKTSADRLMTIVNDFLNITAIKIGTNILDISEKSLKPAIEDILHELHGDIERMHITVTYPKDDAIWPELKVDYGKMRESLFIVVENAVRYNREGGKIDIATKLNNGIFELTVENTGLGITSEEKDKIGSALFYRGDFARQAYPVGMGIGLSVVKAIIKAHHGSFEIDSRGKSEGAMVRVTIPI